MQTGVSNHTSRLLKILSFAIIGIGILLRLWVYIENRNLWTDEVNIALNIIERNFANLAQPLSYGQYAPPVFLWITKLSSILAGTSEKAFRLYPLLCGIGSLFVLKSILDKLTTNATWYPILILATGIFFLRYSTEVKQYIPDAFMTLILVWLALRINFKSSHFLWIWLIAGTIATWSSMPSVFTLAAVAIYYSVNSVNAKAYSHLLKIVTVSVVWLLQFCIYYYTILHTQISSDFLVNYHQQYFLSNSIDHNTELIRKILNSTFGEHDAAVYANSLLLLIGIFVLLFKKDSRALLFSMPIIFMLLAAALKQYSLIPRLTLFCMPLLLILTGIGLDKLLRFKNPVIRALVIAVCLVSFSNTRPFSVFSHPIEEESITQALDYLKKKQLPAEQIYVYSGAANSYRYYIQHHPDKEQWQYIQKANLMPPDANTSGIAHQLKNKAALVYTIPFDSYYTKLDFEKGLPTTDTFTTKGCTVFIFGH